MPSNPALGGRTLDTWVVPGAPLDDGRGWRIWYSKPDSADFRPQPVVVRRGGKQEETDQSDWRLLEPLSEFKRRMGVLTVRLAQRHPGDAYDVLVPEAGLERPFRWRTLADDLGKDRDGVTFLFGSCWWRNNDREGAYATAVADLVKKWKPAFKLLIGDQVYQDWPWDLLGPDSPMLRYAERYEQYWGDPGYQQILTSTPNFFMADDHEFWNDYPEKQMQLARTWTREGRKEHGDAAQALYERYQRCLNPGDTRWFTFRVGRVSFFVVDTRSERTHIGIPEPHFILKDQWLDLEGWVQGLTGPGVLVIGQPMFTGPGSRWDHKLPDFAEDYGRLCSLFEKSLRGDNNQHLPHDILMLSGDIHVGRHSVARVAGITPYNEVHELIASASSQIGHLWKPDPKPAPNRVIGRYRGRMMRWDVVTTRTPRLPTIDNNIGLVRMSEGTNGRVRFQMAVWRIRPYDARSWIGRLLGGHVSQGPLVPVFEREIELR